MSAAPLRDDDHQARADIEADCIRLERNYAIERHEQLARYHDFAPAGGPPPRTCRAENDDPGLDISSSGRSRAPTRARAASLLRRIFASNSGIRREPRGRPEHLLDTAGPATTSTSLTD